MKWPKPHRAVAVAAPTTAPSHLFPEMMYPPAVKVVKPKVIAAIL